MNSKPIVEILVPSGPLLTIHDEQGPMVTIARDGSLTFGDSYDPDEAARIFWDAIARWRDSYLRPTQ